MAPLLPVARAMSEQEVPSSVAQRVIMKFLAREGVKSSETLRRLQAQFRGETLSRFEERAGKGGK